MSRDPRAAGSTGWQSRAAGLGGELAPDPSWTLSASEIGAYAFCPQAWYLQRCRLPVTAETEARRDAGSLGRTARSGDRPTSYGLPARSRPRC